MRYGLLIAYDGTHFAGSQRQKNARTVQGDVYKRQGWGGQRTLSPILQEMSRRENRTLKAGLSARLALFSARKKGAFTRTHLL